MPLYSKKYKPKTLKEVIGQDMAIKQLHNFVLHYQKQKKKALLLYGPTGTGKTCSVHALAHELNLELIEMNASDVRDKEKVESIIGSAVKQKSLFAKGKIILIDEIDGISGQGDRGALPAIVSLLQRSTFPVISTITNPWDYKFSSLRQKSLLVGFQPLNSKDIFSIIKRVCILEKIELDDESLASLARRSGGDARAALNDLQVVAAGKIDAFALEELSQREREESIISALLKILKTTDLHVALSALDNVKEDLDEQFLWLDENLPKEYLKPKDLARAYDKLSKADIFNRRIKRWQHWHFLATINALLTGGIAAAKDEKYAHFADYKPTGRLLKMWWAKQKLARRKSIAEKLAVHTHSSTREAFQQVPYFKNIFQHNKAMGKEIALQLNLDEEEVEWLKSHR